MNNPEYYQDIAECKASPVCLECEKKIFSYIEDNTQGFDLEPRLRGHQDIQIIPACDEFPEGCKPNECSREVIMTTDELDNWLLMAEKTFAEFKDNETGFKLIELELLIDKIKEKLEER